MFDYEKLILEVESRPFLWNIGSSDYHDIIKKKLGWKAVGEALYDNWKGLSNKEQDEIGKK